MRTPDTVLVVEDACTMQDEGCTQTRGDGLGEEGKMAWDEDQRSGKGTAEAGRETVFSQHHPECLRYVSGGFSGHF